MSAEKGICSIEGCEKRRKGRGWCSAHYERWRLHGDPLRVTVPTLICAIDGCGKPHCARGWCAAHWRRWRIYGDPLGSARGTAADRFWRCVDKRGPDECWPWRTGARYGSFWDGQHNVGAHVFAYALLVGPVSPGLFVLHSCDNPPCCNPAHLFLGTAADNSRDMASKGRSARGERNGNAKLTAVQVRAIRARLTAGEMHRAIAATYGVDPSAIGHIARGVNWRNVVQ